jgi:hypothetical protein
MNSVIYSDMEKLPERREDFQMCKFRFEINVKWLACMSDKGNYKICQTKLSVNKQFQILRTRRIVSLMHHADDQAFTHTRIGNDL